jgi:hypothetical protein
MSELAELPVKPSKWSGCLPTLAVTGLLAAFLFSSELRDERLDREYSTVRKGASRSEAIRILGKPSWDGKCGRVSYPRTGCVHELGYRSWLAPVKPVYWIVQLDNRDRVISSESAPSP